MQWLLAVVNAHAASLEHGTGFAAKRQACFDQHRSNHATKLPTVGHCRLAPVRGGLMDAPSTLLGAGQRPSTTQRQSVPTRSQRQRVCQRACARQQAAASLQQHGKADTGDADNGSSVQKYHWHSPTLAAGAVLFRWLYWQGSADHMPCTASQPEARNVQVDGSSSWRPPLASCCSCCPQA